MPRKPLLGGVAPQSLTERRKPSKMNVQDTDSATCTTADAEGRWTSGRSRGSAPSKCCQDVVVNKRERSKVDETLQSESDPGS